MRLVTKEYLDDHRTDRGAWTLAQIQALGVKWPPPPGWRDAICGTEITDDRAIAFEAGKTVFSSQTMKHRRRDEIARLQSLGLPVPEGLAPICQPLSAKAQRRAEKRDRRRAAKALKVSDLQAKLQAPKPPVKKDAKKSVMKADARATDAFLYSYEWRRVRMVAIKKYGARCQCCGASPDTGAVINVDHIKPRRIFPDLALDVDNLQVLCHECNHGKGNWDMTDWRQESGAT